MVQQEALLDRCTRYVKSTSCLLTWIVWIDKHHNIKFTPVSILTRTISVYVVEFWFDAISALMHFDRVEDVILVLGASSRVYVQASTSLDLR